MAAALAELREHWDTAYAITACETGGEEVWTALRLDGDGYLTAPGDEALWPLIRADYGQHPVPRRDGPQRDYLLERLRARHRDWAIVMAGEGVLAARGTVLLGPHPQRAMSAILDNQRHEDARKAVPPPGYRG
jgi:hypothetical protein